MNSIKNRYDFLLVFDVKDGNPNGDPDAGNLPRVDAETGCGLVTDVCLKRKVRNYVDMTQRDANKGIKPGYDIFVREKAVLNKLIDGAYQALKIKLDEAPKDAKDGKKRNKEGSGQGSEIDQARVKMCETYYDIRTFGAVMGTGANAGQVRGPVQLTFGRSIDPIVTQEHCITRMAVTNEADAEKQGGDNRTMGRKNTVPYGAYAAHGFISAHLAAQTGFTDDDLKLLWSALVSMFEHDHSAARGMMSTQKLIVFKHDSALGCAPAHKLFELVGIKRKDGSAGPARTFSDYAVSIDKKNIPNGVELIEML
ncbi:MAG TPA: type I-C CRISPR-associated protein Cas7/Csd2 [Lentisphaeria bacterium]|nr:MAG: type I-C CRISPR-associated protein Cas7/Csd2 [Lentisphaerae bacterium GWF2_49_21]HBC88774.1 type I-C CRISPR-associated protein Cas7/Csd2 [Lentisphaeria bacterium]